MNRTYTRAELLAAEDADEGICLACGELQHYPEWGNHTPLCVECDQYEVLSAETILRVAALLAEEEEE